MKSANVIRTSRPMQGQVAFVRAMAMELLNLCVVTYPAMPTSFRKLARHEDRTHPGEDSA